MDWPLVASFSALLLMWLAHRRLYRSRLSLSVLDDLPALAGRVIMAALLATIAWSSRSDGPIALHTLAAFAFLGAALIAGRALAYLAVRVLRARGVVAHPALVVGAGRIGGLLAQRLQEHPEYGLLPVGFIDNSPLLAESELPVPVLGGAADLATVARRESVRNVLVAFHTMGESQLVAVLETCRRLNCQVFWVPRLFEMQALEGEMDHVWGIPLVRMRPWRRFSPQRIGKRVFDVVLSLVLVAILAPLLLACAVALAVSLGRPVLFRQDRVGRDGRIFHIYKFRSFANRSPSVSDQVWTPNAEVQPARVGRLLRATSLDELPQLFNVLKGDMSLVGPRPERPFFVQQFGASMPHYSARHRVPVGMTGWAQVHGLRGDTSIEDRARFDNYYIENWSLWGDMKILLRTLAAVVTRKGS